MAAEGAQGLPDKVSGTYIADKTDEVGSMGIEEPEGKGVLLAVWCLRIISHGLKGKHGDNIFPPLSGTHGVNPAAHFAAQEKGRFLIGKSHQADWSLHFNALQQFGNFQQGCHPGTVIVGSGRTENRIVMGTYQNNFIRSTPAGNCNLQVCSRYPLGIVFLQLDPVTCFLPYLLNIACRIIEFVLFPDVSFAYFSGQRENMAAEAVAHALFFF